MSGRPESRHAPAVAERFACNLLLMLMVFFENYHAFNCRKPGTVTNGTAVCKRGRCMRG